MNTMEQNEVLKEEKTLSPALADAIARGGVQEVELPGFGDGRPWRPKLKRVSLLEMARGGSVPNTLLGAVTELYQTGRLTESDLKQSAETMRLIAGAALAEPTLKELDDAGVVLSDLQITAIYLYAQRGVEALRPFREKSGVLDAIEDGADLRGATEQAAGDNG